MKSLKDKLETRREQILEEQNTTPKKHKLYYTGMNHENLNCKEDVKEAVLKYEEYQKDLLKIGITISKEKFIKKWGYKTEDIIFKEIFGDFKE